MILWSIVPSELIFKNISTEATAETIYEEIEYNGIKCIAQRVNSAECRVTRLLTTNPKDYLRSEVQPGSIITYQPY